jgi:hypothetical protein
MKSFFEIRALAVIAAVVFVCQFQSSAQEAPNAAIAPFVNDQSLFVMRIDAGRVNPIGMVDWMASKLAAEKVEQPGINAVRKNWQIRAERSTALLTGLRNANAPHLYWVLSVADIADVQSIAGFWEKSANRGVWVVPLKAGSDGAAVMRLITADRARNGQPVLEAKQIGNAVVAAAPGHLSVPGDRALSQEWTHALSGNGPIQIAMNPGTNVRRAYEENSPNVSTANGSVPITVFTRGLQWVSVSLGQPPATQFTCVIQATDPAAAKAANDGIMGALKGIHGAKLQLPWWVFPPIENLDTLVSFRLEGSQLKWTPDIANMIEPLAMREIRRSVELLASENIKQLLLGAIMYANNTKQFPPDIATLMKDQHLAPNVVKDPLHPEDPIGYEYIKPANWQKDVATTPVIYEKWSGGRLVGFADGHVELMENRTAVENLIQKHKAVK